MKKATCSPPEKPYVTSTNNLEVAPPEEKPYNTGIQGPPRSRRSSDTPAVKGSAEEIRAMYNNIIPVVNDLISMGSTDSASNILNDVVTKVKGTGAYKNGDSEVNKIVDNLNTTLTSLTSVVGDL